MIALNTKTRRISFRSARVETPTGWTLDVCALGTDLTLGFSYVQGCAILHLYGERGESVVKIVMTDRGDEVYFRGRFAGSVETIADPQIRHCVECTFALLRESDEVVTEAEARVAARLAA